MTVTVALAGDTMLGRGVARTLTTTPPAALVAPEVRDALGQADLVVLNLECCISERGRRWDAPGKPFFFRAPPRAVELLILLGVDCVTLANNHALDYGVDALTDPGGEALDRQAVTDDGAAAQKADPGHDLSGQSAGVGRAETVGRDHGEQAGADGQQRVGAQPGRLVM